MAAVCSVGAVTIGGVVVQPPTPKSVRTRTVTVALRPGLLHIAMIMQKRLKRLLESSKGQLDGWCKRFHASRHVAPKGELSDPERCHTFPRRER